MFVQKCSRVPTTLQSAACCVSKTYVRHQLVHTAVDSLHGHKRSGMRAVPELRLHFQRLFWTNELGYRTAAIAHKSTSTPQIIQIKGYSQRLLFFGSPAAARRRGCDRPAFSCGVKLSLINPHPTTHAGRRRVSRGAAPAPRRGKKKKKKKRAGHDAARNALPNAAPRPRPARGAGAAHSGNKIK